MEPQTAVTLILVGMPTALLVGVAWSVIDAASLVNDESESN